MALKVTLCSRSHGAQGHTVKPRALCSLALQMALKQNVTSASRRCPLADCVGSRPGLQLPRRLPPPTLSQAEGRGSLPVALAQLRLRLNTLGRFYGASPEL